MNLVKFFAKPKASNPPNRRTVRYTDILTYGLEYNKINTISRVSKRLWSVDIARTPQVVKDIHEYVNVQNEAWLVNSHSSLIHYKASKIRGKGR